MKRKNFDIQIVTINLKTLLSSKSLKDNLRRLFQRKLFSNKAHIAVHIKFEITTKLYKSSNNKFYENNNMGNNKLKYIRMNIIIKYSFAIFIYHKRIIIVCHINITV